MIGFKHNRKKKSEKILKALKVPINKHLPMIENEKAVSLRTKEEILNRTIPLAIVAAKAMEKRLRNLSDDIKLMIYSQMKSEGFY